MNTKEVIDELQGRINHMIKEAEEMSQLDSDTLSAKPSPQSWSAIECIEHINRYSDFYIPELNRAIEKSRHESVPEYKPTWLGNKSAVDMLPQNGVIKKPMKTFKSKNPSLDVVKPKALEKFLKQQKEFLKILESSRNVSLDRTKTKTTLPLIKFKLGDTLRFVIYHSVRHVLQAQNAIASKMAAA